jgi:hypothetical protein
MEVFVPVCVCTEREKEDVWQNFFSFFLSLGGGRAFNSCQCKPFFFYR